MCATLDAVHRVTVLCVLSHISGLHGVFGLCCRPCPCCATLFYYAVLILCCAVLCVYCAVYVYPPCRRWWLVKESHGRPRARMGARYQCLPTPQTRPIDPGAPSTIRLPIVTNTGDQTKNHVVLHVESPTKPYQEYRYPVLAVRNPLVDLAWSGVRLPGVTT